MTSVRSVLVALAFLSCLDPLRAATHDFGTGSYQFAIEFVSVGNAGNRADERYQDVSEIGLRGAVNYPFEIAKYEEVEVSIDNAIVGGLAVKIDQRGPQAAVTGVTFEEAARFANWLNADSGFPDAYKFDGVDVVDWSPEDVGYNPANPARNRFAKYALPTWDEWYKAAYYDADSDTYYEFATGSNEVPARTAGGTSDGTAVYGNLATDVVSPVLAGGTSPYGTVGQSGNAAEWIESHPIRTNEDSRLILGGYFGTSEQFLRSNAIGSGQPGFENSATGFRIVSVPEPSSGLVAVFGIICLVVNRRRGASHPMSEIRKATGSV